MGEIFLRRNITKKYGEPKVQNNSGMVEMDAPHPTPPSSDEPHPSPSPPPPLQIDFLISDPLNLVSDPQPTVSNPSNQDAAQAPPSQIKDLESFLHNFVAQESQPQQGSNPSDPASGGDDGVPVKANSTSGGDAS